MSRLLNLYGSKKISIFIWTGLTLSLIGAGITWIPILQEQQHYLSLSEEQGEQYILNEMSCNTLLVSVNLHESPESIPLKQDRVTRAETVEECWDNCQVFFDGYTPEPDHYFFHINEDTGYKYFLGLDERVKECKSQ